MKAASKKSAAKLTVAVAQMKFRPSIAQNVAWIQNTVRSAAGRGADVVLFPECSVTGYNRDFSLIRRSEIENAIAAISETAWETNCNVVAGAPTFRGRKRLNSLLAFDRRGREIFRYSKIHLTSRDAQYFKPGNKLAFFRLDGILCTAIICHERRYPELVRLPVMMGAQIIFHANAGLDTLEVSRKKRNGKDGIALRAFENDVYYVFSNSVGPQGNSLWSAGDSKIVAPDSQVLAQANNRDDMIIQATLKLSNASRKYATEALAQPAFLRAHWKALLAACRRRSR
jgi:predicted amidohydrolase